MRQSNGTGIPDDALWAANDVAWHGGGPDQRKVLSGEHAGAQMESVSIDYRVQRYTRRFRSYAVRAQRAPHLSAGDGDHGRARSHGVSIKRAALVAQPWHG